MVFAIILKGYITALIAIGTFKMTLLRRIRDTAEIILGQSVHQLLWV